MDLRTIRQGAQPLTLEFEGLDEMTKILSEIDDHRQSIESLLRDLELVRIRLELKLNQPSNDQTTDSGD